MFRKLTAPRYTITAVAPNKKPFWQRHIITSIVLMLLGAPLVMAMMVGMARGVTGASTGPQAPSIERSYADCLALAKSDQFAPEVCSGLDPHGPTAITNCSYERAHTLPLADCPKS